ncbi:primosomal protein N' [candidate division WOR-1 bacterium RIFCSPLOWO2_02_FULL_46_20]|uniref:Replication restart protein PriA n=1 Tax=candidate division WOR-1 bacterium RIFCSPLOWO2_02_FULL_46_20 TaxID=1802567 RepID=A0A1F4RES3_UNCSA|nr:MAG: primosomal protein N' [candidate division WOR-1 bacterium RIFCSPHIGHO2_02_FULL_45_12]OGC06003.1 MAG: primosomal protein N' [candidate division WOR-1 bacterium RIFCSPLOWO2_02_FULL_46_20]
MYAEIIISRASRNIDKIFHYSIPPEIKNKIQIGHQVVVPFGRRQEIGHVVGFVETSNIKGIRDILRLASDHPLFNEKQAELAKWLADYYCSFLFKALQCVLPPGGKSEIRSAKFEINQKSEIPSIKPTEEQEKAIEAINGGQADKFLLYGVTGSGKTEIYLQTVAHVLEQGKSAIVLVPEIGLTPQLVERFKERFHDQIAVLHSHLALKQRKLEWQRVASSEARIILGTRMAIFAPVKNLGLIVLDEEYEITYKSEQSPRYHTREVAFFLSALHRASVVLGSATPTVETYYQAEKGNYQKLVLSKRIDDRELPPVKIVDMREAKGFILSDKLREELKETLRWGQQAILFINRRGYFTFVMCRECGLTIECPKCSVSLTYHTGVGKVVCNRCGYQAEIPRSCPRCNSLSIKYFGSGTQRIEKEVADLCPDARILRYDRDSLGERGSHEQFFAAFAGGKADVLIGTQLVTKGLDVANVTLVGVVTADTGLNFPDFRSAEHTFQLLTQVAGRAGRHHLPGKVIIQTYNPDHYAIQAAAKHDYESFYQQEIKHRQELNYPPFTKLISLIISGASEPKVIKVAEDLGQFLKKRLAQGVLGPAPAATPKVRGHFRHHILMKGSELLVMSNVIREVMKKIVIPSEVRVAVDVEPMNMH